MDVVTYALLKKKIDEIVGGYVTDEEMTEAISNAVSDLVSDTEMANAIATATVDFLTETEINSLISNSIEALIPGFSYKGTVATISALPTGATQGDCYTVDENLGTYVWDGTKWFEYNINLDLILQEGTEETAKYHLGFYLDENGDLNQVDD